MIVAQIITTILILIVLIVILIDLNPIIKQWVSRIHIGRFNDKNQWRKSLIEKSTKWLNNTPKIKVTDNTRLIIIDKLKGNYTKNAIQHWQQGSLLLGLNEIYENDNKVKNSIDNYLNSHFDNNGQWNEKPQFVDCAILSYAVMKLDSSDKYKRSFDYTYNLIKELIGYDGTVMYRKSMANYRYVDTVGFICPFLVKYGLKYNCDEAIKLAVNQIKEYFKYGFDKDSKIPFHAYDIKNKYKLGLCGWGRGLGWFALGLIDSWLELPKDSDYKKQLEEIIIQYSEVILSVQLDNGGFGWTVTRRETRVDSSTTATLAWFLLNASEIKGISGKCKTASNKAIKYLMTVTKRDGAIEFSQGDTKDIGVYSMLFDIMPFTQGLALRTVAMDKGE